VCCSEHDLRYTRCCVASIRRWYPNIPISLVKDETNRPFDTRELEQGWNVRVFQTEHPVPSGGWSKLEPLLLPTRQRSLILDSDIVFLGRVIERLETIEADFIVESVGGWMSLLDQHYFDLEALQEQFDPGFKFPGYTFNVGQLVATSGILRREDFEPLVLFSATPQRIRSDIFGGHDQGVINYVLLKKAQEGELSLGRVNFMLWGWSRLPRSGSQAIRTGRLSSSSPYPYLIHWHGRKLQLFWLMRNGRLLRHFERDYYSRVPRGRLKRAWRTARLAWAIVSGRQSRRVLWNDPTAPGFASFT